MMTLAKNYAKSTAENVKAAYLLMKEKVNNESHSFELGAYEKTCEIYAKFREAKQLINLQENSILQWVSNSKEILQFQTKVLPTSDKYFDLQRNSTCSW